MSATIQKVSTLIICFLFAATTLIGADSKKEEITGSVSVTKNEKGKIESITLSAEGGKSYTIAPTGKGAKLAKEAEGETVKINGKILTKNKEGEETLILSVSSYVIIFKGAVAVERNDKKKITGVTLGGRPVKLDGKAKEMAEKAEGKEITATGEVMIKKAGKDKEEEKILIIKEFELDEEKK